jgi:hypothetical protein
MAEERQNHKQAQEGPRASHHRPRSSSRIAHHGLSWCTSHGSAERHLAIVQHRVGAGTAPHPIGRYLILPRRVVRFPLAAMTFGRTGTSGECTSR